MGFLERNQPSSNGPATDQPASIATAPGGDACRGGGRRAPLRPSSRAPTTMASAHTLPATLTVDGGRHRSYPRGMGNELPTIFADYADALGALPDRARGDVFHYTSAEAVHAIVCGSSMFASHIATLNDISERQHGWAVIDEVWERVQGELPRRAADLLADGLSARNRATAPSSYVISASKRSDDLSQYRAYGYYVLGLPTGPWQTVAQIGMAQQELRRPITAVWREVVYSRTTAKRLAEQMFWVAARATEVGVLSSARMVTRWFDHLAVHFKHEAFRSEREVRLVFASTAEGLITRTRPVAGTIRPYMEVAPMEFAVNGQYALPVTSIRLGPLARGEVDRLGVDYLLRTAVGEHHGVEVLVSRIPFR